MSSGGDRETRGAAAGRGRTAALVLVLLLASAQAPAPEADDREGTRLPREGSLLPIPGLLRPPPPPQDGQPAPLVVGGCGADALPSLAERLPFGPGEALAYDVSILGIRTGRVRLKMSERTEMDGLKVYPLHASATTTGFLTVLGELDGHMVSFFDPSTLLPVRMVNQVRVSVPFKDAVTNREDAAFGEGGTAHGRLERRSVEGAEVRTARLRATSDLLDVLSVVYYMRSRRLDDGKAFCFEIYHRRRLWRAEGEVGPLETVSTPAGARRGRRIDATLRRLGGGPDAPPPRPITAWVSHDGDRLPLLVRTPDRLGHIEVRLRSFSPGRRLVEVAPR